MVLMGVLDFQGFLDLSMVLESFQSVLGGSWRTSPVFFEMVDVRRALVFTSLSVADYHRNDVCHVRVGLMNSRKPISSPHLHFEPT